MVTQHQESAAQLFCHVAEDTGAIAAEADITALREGKATCIIKVVSEMYFHRLRLEVARDPEFAKHIKVAYQGQLLGLDYCSELYWPADFLSASWKMEMEINAEREKRRTAGLKGVV